MKQVDYVEYKHSYAHQLEKKMKALNYSINVLDKPLNYGKAIVKNALENPEVIWSDKERYFFDVAMNMKDKKQLYYYCKNAINKARSIMIWVDEEGEQL